MSAVYYSQEDSRWRNTMFSNHGDPAQTIGTSACGPTSAAMAISTLTGETILPTAAAAYAVSRGFRTFNDGTDWSYFKSIAESYGLSCKQTGYLNDVKEALTAGLLVIATMGKGHLTGGGHYVLLVGINGEWISVHDSNPDNTRYGHDGLVDQGIKNDGRIRVHESAFRNEAKQYWIFNSPEKGDAPMTAEEKAAFDALTARVKTMEGKQALPEIPDWALEACKDAKRCGSVDTTAGGSFDFYRTVTMLHRAGVFNSTRGTDKI